MSTQRVLLVAPDVGLPKAADEARAISLALNCTSLIGTVTRRDVLDALPAKQWDIIWFATHGSVDGIMLSDGTIGASDLAALVRNTPVSLVVLNTCESRLIGLDIHYELDVDVIATVAEVDDATAYQTGVLLARNLALGMSNRDAFERSRPGSHKNFHMFSDENENRDSNTTILMMNEVLAMWASRLSAQIEGNARQHARDISEIREEIKGMRKSVENAVGLPPWHKPALALSVIFLALPTAMFFAEFRDIIGIEWRPGMAFTFLSYFGFASLLAYMFYGSRSP